VPMATLGFGLHDCIRPCLRRGHNEHLTFAGLGPGLSVAQRLPKGRRGWGGKKWKSW